MKVTATRIPDVLLIEPARFGDNRGFFSESWNKERMAEHGISVDFVQDNHSLSSAAGTVRGLQVGSPEEIAYSRGWITAAELQKRAESFAKNSYGQYLLN
ncbi:dTDP-4-dehydrorhamnose 3,5-epimerase family protein, partial [Lentibacter algarum]|uniref:dTDP-4-dehydrorhamnose 3,5-epimerase family protein n=1 Tax=Lentibacter algarum TaxID=576131 RepID=UPI002354C358